MKLVLCTVEELETCAVHRWDFWLVENGEGVCTIWLEENSSKKSWAGCLVVRYMLFILYVVVNILNVLLNNLDGIALYISCSYGLCLHVCVGGFCVMLQSYRGDGAPLEKSATPHRGIALISA